MSVKSTESIAANQYKITFDVDKATFEAAINKVYKNSVKNITIPGFRKGKAPRAIVEKMYGKEVFYEDAINEVIPSAYTEAVKDFEKTIVSQPEFDVETIDENGVVLVATFYTKPEAEIADYPVHAEAYCGLRNPHEGLSAPAEGNPAGNGDHRALSQL